jgi:hypothetical protein
VGLFHIQFWWRNSKDDTGGRVNLRTAGARSSRKGKRGGFRRNSRWNSKEGIWKGQTPTGAPSQRRICEAPLRIGCSVQTFDS